MGPDLVTERFPVFVSRGEKSTVSSYLELLPDIWDIAKVYPSVMYPQYLMDHCLVGPLGQQRRHRVVPSIQNQKYRRRVGFSKFEELVFLGDLISHLNSELLRQQTVFLVSDKRLLLQRQ